MKPIGILALQGDVEKHYKMIEKLGVRAIKARTPEDISSISALVIPGGESTTMGKLLDRFGILAPLREKIQQGFPVYGTCAGAILLAKNIENSEQLRIGTMDITVSRNAYGRQIESFETEITSPFFGDEAMTAVFIRAPIITAVKSHVEVLLSYENKAILVRQNNMLAGTFHPELTSDNRIHKYFVEHVVLKVKA
ncbi:MAG: pyridoxal 5'-phosphate synthase glutaminase subunit PdxT [Spirochaetales bacterium]|nr:pyridoxal 5'-phosphate synthase glutaminase subunit PdxT [Spirochaetales bacterium]